MTKEADVISACKRYLTTLQTQGQVVFTRINVGPVLHQKGGRQFFRKNHDMRGLSDFIVWLKNGPTLAVECKSDDGDLRDEQEAFRDNLIRIGHKYHVVRSLDDLIAVLKIYELDHFSNRRTT
jgi:hypothetical protein